jgi:hypothetical protein
MNAPLSTEQQVPTVESLCAQIDQINTTAMALITKLQKQRDDLENRMLRIHLLACYCTEEDTGARYQCLLEIGKIARGEVSSALDQSHG